MYKVLGIGFLGLFALLAVPAIQEDIQTTYMGGMVTMILYDSFGEELMFQQVHNLIVDDGEDHIVDAVFADGQAPADSAQVGKICPFIYTPQDIFPSDGNTTTTFNNLDENTGNPQCIGRINVDTATGTPGQAVVGTNSLGATVGYNFQGSGGNSAIGDNQLLRGIGVFIGSANSTAPDTTLFAVIDTNDVTVGSADTVNIKYTFDISSAGN